MGFLRAGLVSLCLASAALVVPVSAPPVLAAAPRAPEEAPVVAAFERARGALSAGRGAEVLGMLTKGSVAKLDAVRTAAHAGDGPSLDRLDSAGRFAALGLRRFLSPAELRRMKTGDIADVALKKGWLGPNIISQAVLGPVRVKGDRANAVVMVDGRPSLVQADFMREGGQWRIDLTQLFNTSSAMLDSFAAIAGKSERQFTDELLEKLAKRVVK